MSDDKYDKILSRLSAVEQHLINLIFPIQGISHAFSDKEMLNRMLSELISLLKTPLRVEDNSLLKVCNAVNVCANDTKRISQQLQDIDILKFAEEIKFMAKRVYEMERRLANIDEVGIKKNIHLDLTMDGYEMVRRSEKKTNTAPSSDDERTEKLLDTLLEKEKLVIIHRYGLLGNKPKTLEATGKEVGTTRERVRQIESKALRKLRHEKRRELVKAISHKELKRDIKPDLFDEDE